MKTKLVIINLIIAILISFCTISNSAENPKLYLKCSDKYKNQDEIMVEVYMENINSKISVLSWDIQYDSKKLQYVKQKVGEDLVASYKLSEDIPEENRIATGVLALNGLSKGGLYYTFTFKVLDDSNNIDVNLKVKECTDSKRK